MTHTCLFALLVTCAGASTSKPEIKSYTFTLDGKPHTPSFASQSGDKDQLRPGDVIWPSHMAMTIGEPGTFHLATTPEKDGRVFLQNADGSRRVVAAKVSFSYEGPYDDRKTVFHNPLSELTPAEIGGLWGVTLDAWPDGIEDQLKHIDPARTCVMIDDNVLEDDPTRLASVPSDTRYLRIYENASSRDLKPLEFRTLTQLRHLDLSFRSAVDLRQLRCFDTLEYLNGSGEAVTNTEAIAAFRNLRFIDLGWSSVRDIEFVKKLSKLETLVIDMTSVTNLSPLSACEQLQVLSVSRTPVTDLSTLSSCGNLRILRANKSLVDRLPQTRMPALQELRVMNANLSDEAVAAFQALNPQCKVFHRWHAVLRRHVEDADTIQVLEWQEIGESRLDLRPVHAIRRPEAPAELLKAIDINEKTSGSHCMCMGGPAIGFYDGTNVLVTITLHHGTGMRWDEGWPGDAALTPTSQVAIAKWFEENGYPGIEKARQALIAEARLRKQEDAEFWACFPDAARTYFESAPWTNNIPDYSPGMGDYWSASPETKARVVNQISEMIGDPVTAVVSACKAMGSRQCPHSWSGRSERESMAVSVATNVSSKAFLKGLSRAEEDKKAMLGAALLFFSEHHGATLPKKEGVDWCLKLGKFVLAGEGNDEKTAVLHWLLRAETPECLAVVRAAASGKYGDVDVGEWREDSELGLVATGCLLLAMRHDDAAKPLVMKAAPSMKRKPDIAALEIASVLVGITNRVKKAHFEITSWTIPEAAAQSVVENPNQENIDLLIDFAINNDYASVSHPALEAFAKIAGFDWYENGERPKPGQRDKAKEWWKQNRHRFKPAAAME